MTAANEKVIDVSGLVRAERSTRASAHFREVGRFIPPDQNVVWVPPETPARDALQLLHAHGFSQVPVMTGNRVHGFFSYRAFSLECVAAEATRDMGALSVSEFLDHEETVYARFEQDLPSLLTALQEKEVVAVGSERSLVGVLTSWDVLERLHSATAAFLLVEEVELSLRQVIRAAAPSPSAFVECCTNALSQKYKDGALPQTLLDLSFDDYVALIRDGRNWKTFGPLMLGTRDRWKARLEEARDYRNRVFHFRGHLLDNELGRLKLCRNQLQRVTSRLQLTQGDAT